MTQARRIAPGTTYLITRSCAGRRFKMAPRGLIKKLVPYCVALFATRYGIEVHAVMVMSNHWHAVVTDPHGNISLFTQRVHETVAKVMNAEHPKELSGFFWDPAAKPSYVALVTPEDVWRYLVYVSANPVTARLVESSSKWPGFRTRPEDALSEPTTWPRPKAKYFGAKTTYPDAAKLAVKVPPALAHMGAEDFVAGYRSRLADREADERATAKAKGETFRGLRWVTKVRRITRPKQAPQSDLEPHIACCDKEARIAALEELVQFRRDYRAAWLRWKAGERDVVFPHGTFKMVRFHGARCEGRPPPK